MPLSKIVQDTQSIHTTRIISSFFILLFLFMMCCATLPTSFGDNEPIQTISYLRYSGVFLSRKCNVTTSVYIRFNPSLFLSDGRDLLDIRGYGRWLGIQRGARDTVIVQ